MIKVTHLESGYDFITLYFKTPAEMSKAAEKLYAYLPRLDWKHYGLQRKNFMHKPGDVPHFHNGIDATKGAHFHIIYPDRPTEADWEELRTIFPRRLVGIDIDGITNQEIS